MMRRCRTFVLLFLSGALLPSCAAITVDALPQPGGDQGGGYEIVLQFQNVLNLPNRAKVVQDGRNIGMVERIDLRSDRVDVTARVDGDARVPVNVAATLQQSTVLGDTYVALTRPDPQDFSIPGLEPGQSVPLSQTTSPPQLEDTIASLANFAGSGSIQRLQNSVIKINNVTPAQRADMRQMVSRVTTDLSDLAADIDTVDTWLDGVAGTAEVMRHNTPVYDYWFSPDGMLGFDRSSQVAGYVGTVLPSIGSIYSGGYWLVPMLNSLGNAMGAVQQTKWNFEDEAPAWRRLLTDKFLPADKNPAINITSIVGPDGRELGGDVEAVLRILGATP